MDENDRAVVKTLCSCPKVCLVIGVALENSCEVREYGGLDVGQGRIVSHTPLAQRWIWLPVVLLAHFLLPWAVLSLPIAYEPPDDREMDGSRGSRQCQLMAGAETLSGMLPIPFQINAAEEAAPSSSSS